MRIYEVELNIIGAISIQNPINFNTEKELEIGSVFNSSIKITNFSNGLKIATTVRTLTVDRANKIALLFVGKMIDVLSFKINLPITISSNENISKTTRTNVKAIIEKEEFRSAFEIAKWLNLNHTTFLRGLNWYRKGSYTDDPFDKFLAYWNSITIVATKYFTPNEKTSAGAINQTWNCFETLWGVDVNEWVGINNNNRWINEMQEIRNNIAHGFIPVELEYVEDVISKLENVKDVANNFLNGWYHKLL